MKVFYVMVLVLVARAVPSHGRTESEGTVFNKTQPHESMNNATVSSSKLVDYGHMYLAMQWPRSFCKSKPPCNRQVPSRFTVHGQWPQYDPSIYDGGIDCRYTGYPRFNSRQLNQNLVQRLNWYWPDLARGDNQRFWGAEYNKHGSCTFNDQNEYFSLTLTMVEYLGDLISKLSQINGGPRIVPGYVYSPGDIIAAVYKATNKIPMLHCIPDWNGQILLLEIRFCANRNSNPASPLADCIPSWDCGDGVVYLPPP